MLKIKSEYNNNNQTENQTNFMIVGSLTDNNNIKQ